jgi:hypothetical protein
MDTNTTFDRLLTDLRGTFEGKLPSGLTEKAETRLRRTVEHFMGEVTRTRGLLDEQEVLRTAFDSMTSWYRRNTDQIFGYTGKSPFAPTDYEPAVAPDLIPGGGATRAVGGSARMDGEVDDPMAMFQQDRVDMTRFLRPDDSFTRPTDSAGPTPPMPSLLKPIETRVAAVTATDVSFNTGVQQKDFIQKQEDVVKYREVEYNLLLNSKDRDWLNSGPKQNRYNFSVVLDSTARPQGTGPQPTITNKFRNIVRVEFVKAILPVEGLEVVRALDPPNSSPAVDNTNCYSVLALPFINVLLAEWTANNVGTNPTIDQSLAICQYDATWRSDGFSSAATAANTGPNNVSSVNRGYTLFIPKFMKAQRVYAPTPLANFQRLSFQIVGPENQPLSLMPDSSAVNSIVNGSLITGNLTVYDNANYIAVLTNEFFPHWMYSQLDRISFAGLSFASATSTIDTGGKALIDWLQRAEGHVVVGIGYSSTIGSYSNITDGANSCGYANVIFIQNRISDPAATGVCVLDYFTDSQTDDETMYDQMAAYPSTYQEGGVLNLSRQVQLVLRVITRELDPTTTTRPDNI